jgi:hypothetical protein
MQSFKVGAPDAEFLEKEYAPVLSAQDIIGISNFKTYLKLNINNATSRVFSIDSLWSQDYKNPKVGEILKEYSAKKYGRKREFVEAEISARLGILPEDVDNLTPDPSTLDGYQGPTEMGDENTDDSVIARSEDTSDAAIQSEEVDNETSTNFDDTTTDEITSDQEETTSEE